MTLRERDQAVIWHPFTQHQIDVEALPIVRGEGAYLFDEHGNKYLDLVSSWLVNVHGHSHPVIAKAIYEQALKLEHVIFAGFTHEPAVALAEKLIQLLPPGFSKAFYTDNGSTAVEVGIKMAYQYWRNLGEPGRKRILAFTGAYHGDTFGAMSLGKSTGFYQPFHDLLFPVDLFPLPTTWMCDRAVEAKEAQVLNQLEEFLEQYGHQTAAIIVEPLIQAVSGMQMCRPEFLRQLEKLMKTYDVLVIYDEVMTGFGRTGELFACLKAGTTPDIICLAKGITGGFLPLAVTLCQERIYEAFLGDNFHRALAHGHSYSGNPIGCAAGLASLELLLQPETQQQINMITAVNTKFLSTLPDTAKARVCGVTAAFQFNIQSGYGTGASRQISKRFLEKGLIVRPLGNLFYILPPYCITESELKQAYTIIIEELEGVTT